MHSKMVTHHLSKVYGDGVSAVKALDDISMRVDGGQVVWAPQN